MRAFLKGSEWVSTLESKYQSARFMVMPVCLCAQRPKTTAKPPLGKVILRIKHIDLEHGSDSCFCLLRCGPVWGRSITLPSSSRHDFNWEVCPSKSRLPFIALFLPK